MSTKDDCPYQCHKCPCNVCRYTEFLSQRWGQTETSSKKSEKCIPMIAVVMNEQNNPFIRGLIESGWSIYQPLKHGSIIFCFWEKEGRPYLNISAKVTSCRIYPNPKPVSSPLAESMHGPGKCTTCEFQPAPYP